MSPFGGPQSDAHYKKGALPQKKFKNLCYNVHSCTANETSNHCESKMLYTVFVFINSARCILLSLSQVEIT